MNDWMLQQSGMWVYIGLVAALLGGGFGLPIPEEVPLVIGGVLGQRGNGRIDLILIISYLTVLIADLLLFSIGWRFGTTLLNKGWFSTRITPEKLDGFKKRLESKSLITIFVARHLFYLRTMTFITCGAVKMEPMKFLLADALAALISVTLMIGLGYFASEHLEVLINEAKYLSLALAIIAIIIYTYLRRQKESIE